MSVEGRAEWRAGGTDLTERRRSGVSVGLVRDIDRHPDLTAIRWAADGSVALGALVTLAGLADDDRIRAGYPGLADAAGILATPQLRRVATMGGNLLQHNRCWYYRNPATPCLRKGGTDCPARTGNHRYGVVFDIGPCVAPHPSTIGAALLVYDAMIDTDRRDALAVADLFDTGTRHHTLEPGELLTTVSLAAPRAGERGAYLRVTSRAQAEWPLAEAVARLVVTDGVITHAGVAVGAVAPVPLRLPDVEAALQGHPPLSRNLTAAAELAAHHARPLPLTGYKLPLLVTVVDDALHRAAGLPADQGDSP
ncbi:MAG: FAD binding domain-containing protein [Labedaea sp.]